MIDWITAALPCNHDPSKLISGVVMSFDANGANEWIVNKMVSVEGRILQLFKSSQLITIIFGFLAIPPSFCKGIIFWYR